jgi:hypothetical protein
MHLSQPISFYEEDHHCDITLIIIIISFCEHTSYHETHELLMGPHSESDPILHNGFVIWTIKMITTV